MDFPGLTPLLVTAQLSAVTTLVLILIGTPLAWWLSFSRNRFRPAVEAVVAMPLVLPPTVLGFYLLLAMAPETPLGRAWFTLTGTTLAFSFSGLVVASAIYSLPFYVQPLTAAFSRLGRETLETAANLGASPTATFLRVVLPQCRQGFVVASILAFAHTVGEFGVVLMVGGNIPGVTRVASIAVYDHVEALQLTEAHVLSAILLVFSFIVLLIVYVYLGRRRAMLA